MADNQLTVDLDAYVADGTPRYTADGEPIYMQPNEVRVSPKEHGSCSVVDSYGRPIALQCRSRAQAELIARCINAHNGVTPEPGVGDGALIAATETARSEIFWAEYDLAQKREALAALNTQEKP